MAATSNQVQAASLVWTLWSLGTNGAEVSFLNQPDLDTGQVRPRTLHGAADEPLQQMIHGLLMRDIHEQLHGAIRIESAITIWFHNS